MITVQGLGKRFEHGWLFRNLEFQVEKGQALIIRGRNGSGKSTLLRILAGLAAPTEGRAFHDVGLTLGYSALEGKLYPHLTVREHFELAGALRLIEPNTDAWLERIGLSDAAPRFGAKLSTGMSARVKLALALQGGPDLLLLDEPSAGLDAEGRTFIEEICNEQRMRGALVIATNDDQEAELGTHELVL